MLTEKDHCDLELTTILQEVGMPIKNVVATSPQGAAKWYSNVTLYEAQKWLREEKKIEVNATYDNVVELHWHWYMKSLTNRNQTTSIINHDSYEQALLAGIKVAVKILKDGNNN